MPQRNSDRVRLGDPNDGMYMSTDESIRISGVHRKHTGRLCYLLVLDSRGICQTNMQNYWTSHEHLKKLVVKGD